MSECVDCRWHLIERGMSLCTRPKAPAMSINMSTAQREHSSHADLSCLFERSGRTYPIPTCGPEGRFFQELQ